MVTVDRLSGGRATFALGTGYLRSEFAGLGVDLDERNTLFDEALDVLDKVWAGQPVDHEGTHFTARGAVFRPGPVQKPRPPVWIGGNSTLSLKRVAARADGWAAMVGPPIVASTARTPSISTLEELSARIADLRGRLDANNRAFADIDICAGSPGGAARLDNDHSAQQRIDELTTLAGLGVSWTGVSVGRGGPSECIERLHRFGAEVIAQMR
jgi:alkanesulfonate monooxygenase SsuD/methylene tetrahydromethanopterin reductase-like flavin-dependent oxidoreductase (luciferase family)